MGKFVDKVKTGAKKTWTWIKAHPGETCLMVGSAIIGGVTGSKIGRSKGYKQGFNNGFIHSSEKTWANHCEDYGWDPKNDTYGFAEMSGVAAPIEKWIKALNEQDPERLMSGRLVYDDTVEPVDRKDHPNTREY